MILIHRKPTIVIRRRRGPDSGKARLWEASRLLVQVRNLLGDLPKADYVPEQVQEIQWALGHLCNAQQTGARTDCPTHSR